MPLVETAMEKSDAFAVGKMMYQLLLAREDGGKVPFPHPDRATRHYKNSDVRVFYALTHSLTHSLTQPRFQSLTPLPSHCISECAAELLVHVCISGDAATCCSYLRCQRS